MISSKRLLEIFSGMLSKTLPTVKTGSVTFTIHLRNGEPQNVEIESKFKVNR